MRACVYGKQVSFPVDLYIVSTTTITRPSSHAVSFCTTTTTITITITTITILVLCRKVNYVSRCNDGLYNTRRVSARSVARNSSVDHTGNVATWRLDRSTASTSSSVLCSSVVDAGTRVDVGGAMGLKRLCIVPDATERERSSKESEISRALVGSSNQFMRS